MTTLAANYAWARALVDELAVGGVTDAVVCPGSRSTPLALSLAEHPHVRVHSVLDERTAGFFALGLGMASERPVALVATSGTAGAHFLPAVIEAHLTHVSLIALTADRPWELHGFGAAQTIDQRRLFGGFASQAIELPLPEDTALALTHLRTVVARSLDAGRLGGRGVVHLNVPFREPLAPDATLSLPAAPSSRPGILAHAAGRSPDPSALKELAQKVMSTPRGLIVVGPRRPQEGFSSAARELGEALGYPVIAEGASNVRFGPGPDVVAYADLLLGDAAFAANHRPDLILRFGGGLTSKRLLAWLDAPGPETVLCSDHDSLVDPLHRARLALIGDAGEICRGLMPVQPRPTAWRAEFQAAELRVRQALEQAFAVDTRLTEPRIAREVVAALPEPSALFVSSSMPIREVDSYAAPRARDLQVFVNRGANGIDGITSTALGVAMATRKPTYLLSGDLAFLHDLGGLLIAHRHHIPLTIVVVNNDGGGIFSFLPVAQATPHFEELFGTPHGLTLEHAAALFGASYARPTSVNALREAIGAGAEGGLHVVEVIVDRSINPGVHQHLLHEVSSALASGGPR